MGFSVTSNSFKDGDYLANDHVLSESYGFGCAGNNQSPHLAGTDPPAGVTAETRHAQRGRGGRIADPHFAEADDVHPFLDRHHAVGERRGAFRIRHRRTVGEVLGGMFQGHFMLSESLNLLIDSPSHDPSSEVLPG